MKFAAQKMQLLVNEKVNLGMKNMTLSSTLKLHFEQSVPKIHIYFFIIIYSVLIFVALFEASAKDYVKGGPGDCKVPFLQWDDGRVVQGCAPGTEGIDPSGFQKPVLEVDNSDDCGSYKDGVRNLKSFEDDLGEFVPTSLMGRDSRCLVEYPKEGNIAPENKSYAASGSVFYTGDIENCAIAHKTPDGVDYEKCQGTGTLVYEKDLVVTAGHFFRDSKTKQIPKDFKEKFKFIVRVWVPPNKRNPDEDAWRFEAVGIKEIEFHSVSIKNVEEEVVFIKLEREVSSEVRGEPVPSEYQLNPVSVRDINDLQKINDSRIGLAGFQADKKLGELYKNCEEVRLYDVPAGHYLLGGPFKIHGGDTNGKASGAAILALPSYPNEAGVLLGIHLGNFASEFEGSFDLYNRFNYYVPVAFFKEQLDSFRAKNVK